MRVKNYKSFIDSGEVLLGNGFNFIVGKNNSGKTAFLDCFKLIIENTPHRSTLSVPVRGGVNRAMPSIDFDIESSGSEIGQYFKNIQSDTYIHFSQREDFETGQVNSRTVSEYLERDKIVFKYSFSNSYTFNRDLGIEKTIIRNLSTNDGMISYKVGLDGSLELIGSMFSDPKLHFSVELLNYFRKNVYVFSAERLNVSRCGFGDSGELRPDASNLPEVLNHLANNNNRSYERIISHVKEIFPSVTDVRVRPIGNSFLEIVTWQEDPGLERDDLAIPLSSSGTGLGQILSILYVVLTSQNPKVIVIDEPSNFLHPGAVRHLMDILSKYTLHQYILSTHSPEVIKSVAAGSIHMVTWDRPQSRINSLNNNEIEDTLLIYREVGARLSDVFGADSVLWVEGPTEEIAFRDILASMLDLKFKPIIAAVMSTGDFENKSKVSMISSIYHKLSSSNALLPVAVGFIFDSEKRDEREKSALTENSGGRVQFIERRQFENYLLNPHAISEIMKTIDGFNNNEVSPEIIEDWFKQLSDKPYISKLVDNGLRYPDKEWLETVDAAKVLKYLFGELSENKVEYRKTTHSPQLSRWLLDNKPDELNEIMETIRRVLNR